MKDHRQQQRERRGSEAAFAAAAEAAEVAAEAEAAAQAAAASAEKWARRRAPIAPNARPELAAASDGKEADEARMQPRSSRVPIAPPITPPLGVTPPGTPPRLRIAQTPSQRPSTAREEHNGSRQHGVNGAGLEPGLDGVALSRATSKAEQMLEYYHRKAQSRHRAGAPRSADSDVSGVSGVSGERSRACIMVARAACSSGPAPQSPPSLPPPPHPRTLSLRAPPHLSGCTLNEG